MNDDEDLKQEGKRGEGIDLPGLVKDIALTGLATVFMTEDSVRKYLKDLKVPKELMSSALESAGKKKDDLYRVVGTEVAKVLSKMDVAKEVSKFLESHKVTITFEARKPKVETAQKETDKEKIQEKDGEDGNG